MRRYLKALSVGALCAAIGLSAAQAAESTLYQFVARVAADTRINAFFAATAADPQRLAAFKGKLVDQICQASGGPCKYTGKDMKAAHAGMGVQASHFDALVEDLVAALDKYKVAEADKNALLSVLGPMKRDIVTH